jgi:hypothetical protein
MPRSDRLGIAGIILAPLGIAIAILWPMVRWVGWLALIVAIGLCLYWVAIELRQETPSFVFVFGAPLGDNRSNKWMMMLRHYGPNSAHNCDIEFFDNDRKNIEHQWLVKNPKIPYPPAGLAGKSQERIRINEAGPEGSAGSFYWEPLDPDRQHYTMSISCRDGVFAGKWEITRVDGILRSAITIERGAQWVRQNPHRNPTIFECKDPEFMSVPLATAVPASRAGKSVHPGWKPNHKFEVPVAIVDPNGHAQVVSGVKQPDGSIKTDFGAWNILTEHFGDKPNDSWLRRIFRPKRRAKNSF